MEESEVAVRMSTRDSTDMAYLLWLFLLVHQACILLAALLRQSIISALYLSLFLFALPLVLVGPRNGAGSVV